MTDFDLSRPTGHCTTCARSFSEGESFYSAVFVDAAGFRRCDYGEECWQGPPADALCHYKTRLAKKTERRKVFVGDDVLIELFRRLGDETEPARQRFRFVLALILLRKRLLRYEDTLRDARGECWRMRLMRDKTLHEVYNPQLTDVQITELTGELGVLLHGSMLDDADSPSAVAATAQSDALNP